MNNSFDMSALATASTSSGPEMDAKSILNSILEVQRELLKRSPIDMEMKPDRNGNVYPTLGGLSVTVSNVIPTTKQVAHKRERKWCHRVRFQKDRRFDITYETKPNNDVYLLADKIVVNQEQYDKLISAVPASKALPFSMGFRTPDYVHMEPPVERFRGFDHFEIRPQSVALIRGGV